MLAKKVPIEAKKIPWEPKIPEKEIDVQKIPKIPKK